MAITPSTEATLEESPHGRSPSDEGWFIVNLSDAQSLSSDRFGNAAIFEGRQNPFPKFGVNVRVLAPGQPACLYHRENEQECFLVLDGQCTLIVEGEERGLNRWDFFYAPPGAAHVLVGAGDRPSVILMIGSRSPDHEILYPVEEAAARYGASVERETDNGEEAYAGVDRPSPAPLGWTPPR